MTTTRPTLRALATTLGGHIHDDSLLVDGGKVYCSFTGAVKLQRHGRIVVTLGSISDGDDVLAAAYRAAVRAVAF